MAEAGQALATTQTQTTAPAAENKAEVVPSKLGQFFGNDKLLRQGGLLLGLLAAIAVGVGLFFWAQEPVYRPLYGNLTEQDAAQVLEALQASNIPHRIDERTGTIMVPASEVHGVRLRLAGQGLPRGSGVGYELLQRDQSFGTSQFMETARYQHALETELARSIASLQAVESARVHLAIPRQSVFVRDRGRPRASVVVNLLHGRWLSQGQIAAIVHLVASSVPDLAEEDVTLVDQRGRLLTGSGAGADAEPLSVTGAQFEYKQQLEETYARRIENLLTPVVGAGRVRAQVSARLDFSMEESTAEVFDPTASAVRSEQTMEERRRQSEREAIGIPGALTNQPPGPGVLDPTQGTAAAEDDTINLTQSATRNYEVSKTIRHVRRPIGNIERLSVAVLVDQKEVVNAEGELVREPLSQEELDQLTALVRDAVGLDEARGDTINVISAAFRVPADDEEKPLSIYELLQEPWVLEMGKLVLALLLTLLLIMTVIRPLIFGLLGRTRVDDEEEEDEDEEEAESLPASERPKQLPGPRSPLEGGPLTFHRMTTYEDTLMAARQIVNQEPELAASVVKAWLSDDDK